jgi:hypothetical protein
MPIILWLLGVPLVHFVVFAARDLTGRAISF